jgi:hypothetical protein
VEKTGSEADDGGYPTDFRQVVAPEGSIFDRDRFAIRTKIMFWDRVLSTQ